MGVAQSRTAAGREPRPDREDRLIDGDDLALFIASAPPTLRVEGELDLTNGPTLARVLRARLAAGPRLRVDLGGVTFADVGSLREIYQIAAGLRLAARSRWPTPSSRSGAPSSSPDSAPAPW